ncbi:NlpC/P60 family protein [Geminocystis sp. CENA526]|uniref:C40 family peptidase n=1 Tax=Geminocystis sp. CENA526 TaxID=1355871 RepID=UPI003D6EEBDB
MTLDLLPPSITGEYLALQNINLYAKPDSEELATQMAKGRQLKVISNSTVEGSIEICLCEDSYTAWLSLKDLPLLKPAEKKYIAQPISREKIEALIPQIIEFTYQAMNTPNYYLWGGTVAPNYDCSGLIQSAFASVGIWLPRDSYQQENFVTKIDRETLKTGDLIFFGTNRVTHVALYLGDNKYIHSSGKEIGNNGIKINVLRDDEDQVSRNYYQQYWSCGRVTESFVKQL